MTFQEFDPVQFKNTSGGAQAGATGVIVDLHEDGWVTVELDGPVSPEPLDDIVSVPGTVLQPA